ncbi:MAG: hypothetical protein H7A49_01480 [Akkermansiaceae bacterium]|nr:hypothetical protein [Akkermansiaceae bacterium]MCP5542557.1 hypothetical protein [Akkermansiaceae bacterium]MCP5547903.1 hypothetical protein [Akkermansiaceae bacterium]
MKPLSLLCAAWAALAMLTSAEVTVDNDVLGKSLGGWKKKDGSAAQYPLSGSDYCTYKPEVSPTPEGGIFISVRIDHVRGWMSNNDHATLEITVSGTGVITSAKSSIAIQGVSIASDVILGTNEAGKEITGADRAVQIGTDLVSNLTAKLLRENIVEAGRVTFPAAIRHNYNRLYQALRVDGEAVPAYAAVQAPPPPPAKPVGADASPATTAATTPSSTPATTSTGTPPATPEKPKEEPPADPPPPVAKPVPGNAPLEINPYAPSGGGEINPGG